MTPWKPRNQPRSLSSVALEGVRWLGVGVWALALVLMVVSLLIFFWLEEILGGVTDPADP